MLSLFLALSAVLLTWSVWACALIGLGLAMQRVVKIRAISTQNLLFAFWVGWAVAIAFLQLWHLFLPVNLTAAIVLLVGGIGLLLLRMGEVGQCLKTLVRNRPAIALLGIVMTVWIANRAIGPCDAHDSGLYHLNVIRWNNTYAITPGLGNLHVRLAFNNASLLWQAVVNTPPWTTRGTHIGNGLPLAMLGLFILSGIAALTCSNRQAHAWTAIYRVILLPVWVMMALSKEASSARTDLPAACLVFIIGERLLALLNAHSRIGTLPPLPLVPKGERDGVRGNLAQPQGSIAFERSPLTPALSPEYEGEGEHRGSGGSTKESPAGEFALIVLLAACAATFKLSTGCFAALACLVVFGIRAYRYRSTFLPRAIVSGLICGCLLIVPWAIRGVILSGYPLFPSRAFPVNVDWRVPDDMSDAEIDNIQFSARLGLTIFARAGLENKPSFHWLVKLMSVDGSPEAAAKGFGWIRPWAFSQVVVAPIEVVAPAAILALAVLVGLWRRSFRAQALLVLVPAMGSGIFWLCTAPEPRFGYSVMWTLAASFAAVGFAGLLARPRLNMLILGGSILAVVPVVGYRAMVNKINYHRPLLENVPFMKTGTDHGFHPTPIADLVKIKTHWDLQVYFPTNPKLLTWDAPLPATGFLDADLQPRDPADLSKGFRINRNSPSTQPLILPNATTNPVKPDAGGM